MAKVFVAVAGQHGSNAQSFYQMFPAEAVLPNQQILQIRNVVRVPSPSLYTLLHAIATQRDREIVIVSHGSPTQLALHVLPGINIGVDINVISAILGSSSNANLARQLHTNARHIATLRARIQRVQRLRISRLELRACRVGQSRPTLEALKRLFGATSACAPRAFDGYGAIQNVRPTHNAATLTQWQSAHRGHLTFGTSPNRFFWVNNGSVDPPGISDAFAESWDGVRAWVEAKFPSGTNHRFRRGTFYYHFQTTTLPTSSSVHGSRTFDSNFVFPNDAGYRQNLVQVQSPPTAPPTANPRSAPQGRGPIGLDPRYTDLDIPSNGPMLTPRQGQYRVPEPEGMAT